MRKFLPNYNFSLIALLKQCKRTILAVYSESPLFSFEVLHVRLETVLIFGAGFNIK